MSEYKHGNDLFANGITSWAEHIRSGSLSFEETMDACLQRVLENQALDAFECLDRERALARAAAMDALLASGTDLGPMMGLPLGVKDIIAVEGLPTTNGSNADTGL